MKAQTATLGERLLAVATNMWLHLVMNSAYVRFQMTRVAESLRTMATNMRLLALVNSAYVLIQTAFKGERLHTETALGFHAASESELTVAGLI